MNEINDGGPAFPCHTNPRPGTLNEAPQGMTLRDYFAGQVLNGVLADPEVKIFGDKDAEILAMDVYRIADAMIRVRGKA